MVMREGEEKRREGGKAEQSRTNRGEKSGLVVVRKLQYRQSRKGDAKLRKQARQGVGLPCNWPGCKLR